MTYTVTKVWSLVKVLGNGAKPATKVFVGMYGTVGDALDAMRNVFIAYHDDAMKHNRLCSDNMNRTEAENGLVTFSFKYETENATVRKVKFQIVSHEIKES